MSSEFASVEVVLVGDEVRHAGVHGRAEEAGRDPGDGRERDDRRRRCRRTGARRRPRRGRGRQPTISRRRWKRSTSGPSASPITTIGRKSATSSAATHVPEPVRAKMSQRERDRGEVRAERRAGVARKSSLKWCPRRSRFRRPETRTRAELAPAETVAIAARGSRRLTASTASYVATAGTDAVRAWQPALGFGESRRPCGAA